MDFLSCPKELKGFDVCIDKGTFDAISLNPVNTNEGKRQYVQALKDVLKDNGFFAITSCNWTKEQLLDRFSEGEKKIHYCLECTELSWLRIGIKCHISFELAEISKTG